MGPVGIAIDRDDTLFVANCANNTIRRVSAAGDSTEFASSPLFRCPNGLTIDPAGNLYVANFSDGLIFRVTVAGVVSQIASTPGNNNGHLRYGNDRLYIADRGGSRVFEMDTGGELRAIAGTGARGHRDGAALDSTLSLPNGIDLSPDGTRLYINEPVPTSGSLNGPSTVRIIRLEREPVPAR